MPSRLNERKPATASAGRPRSSQATDAVRAAALSLAYEGGVQHATVERIAEQSGVAKTTIYRRWPNAAAIVMEAYLAEIAPLIPYRRNGSVEATFIATVRRLVAALRGPRGDMLRHLLAASQSDDQLRQAFWDNWIKPRREHAKAVIAEAQAQRQIRSDIDADVLIDQVFGAVYYRLMIPYEDMSGPYVERLVTQVFKGARREPGSAAS